MKSLKSGKSTSISVENITSFGIWLLVKNKEYFLTTRSIPSLGIKP